MDLPIEVFRERLDRHRLRALYADEKDLSSDTISFWKRMLLAYCKSHHSCVLELPTLQEYFTIEGIEPLSLSKAIQLLRSQGELVHEHSLTRSTAYSFVLDSLSSLFSSYVFSIQSTQVVCIPYLHEIEKLIVKKCQSLDPIESVFTMSSSSRHDAHSFQYFLSQLGVEISTVDGLLSTSLTHMDAASIQLLIKYMVSKQSAIVEQEDNIMQVRSSLSRKHDNAVSAVLISKFKLKHTIARLQKYSSEYRTRIEDIDSSLKSRILKKVDKRLLLHDLKVKKCLSLGLDKLDATILQLLPIEQKLHLSEVNALVIDAYKAGTAGLRSLRLQSSQAEEVIDEYMDEADLMDEVHSLLTSGLAAAGIDDDEIEQEYNELLVAEEPVAITAEADVVPPVSLETVVLSSAASPTEHSSSQVDVTVGNHTPIAS